MSLCQYKNIFGAVGTGAHSYRFLGLAIVDVVLTVVVGVLIAWFFRINVVYTVLGFFVAGILLHRLFCVRTTIDKLIFG
jgi:hypothetical protein